MINERQKSAEVAKSGLRRRARDPLVLLVPRGFKSLPRRIFNFIFTILLGRDLNPGCEEPFVIKLTLIGFPTPGVQIPCLALYYLFKA